MRKASAHIGVHIPAALDQSGEVAFNRLGNSRHLHVNVSHNDILNSVLKKDPDTWNPYTQIETSTCRLPDLSLVDGFQYAISYSFQLLKRHLMSHQLPENSSVGEQITPLGVRCLINHLESESIYTLLATIIM